MYKHTFNTDGRIGVTVNVCNNVVTNSSLPPYKRLQTCIH